MTVSAINEFILCVWTRVKTENEQLEKLLLENVYECNKNDAARHT